MHHRGLRAAMRHSRAAVRGRTEPDDVAVAHGDRGIVQRVAWIALRAKLQVMPDGLLHRVLVAACCGLWMRGPMERDFVQFTHNASEWRAMRLRRSPCRPGLGDLDMQRIVYCQGQRVAFSPSVTASEPAAQNSRRRRRTNGVLTQHPGTLGALLLRHTSSLARRRTPPHHQVEITRRAVDEPRVDCGLSCETCDI